MYSYRPRSQQKKKKTPPMSTQDWNLFGVAIVMMFYAIYWIIKTIFTAIFVNKKEDL